MTRFRQTLRRSRYLLLGFLFVETFFLVDGRQFVYAYQVDRQNREIALRDLAETFGVPVDKLRGDDPPLFDALESRAAEGLSRAGSWIRGLADHLESVLSPADVRLAAGPAAESGGDEDSARPGSPPAGAERVRTSPARRFAQDGTRALSRFEKKAKTQPGRAVDPRRKSSAVAPASPPRRAVSKTGIAPEITALAESLGNSPGEIFRFVHDGIDFDPKWGAGKPPVGTLWEGLGTSWEQAWLLRDLLTAAGVDARFEWGEIEIPTEILTNITGVDDPFRAGDLLTTAGTPIVLFVSGSQVVGARMSHVWVKAHLDYIPNRGATPGAGDTWVRMDPSLKRFDVAGGVRLDEQVAFDLGEYLQSGTLLSPRQFHEEALASYIADNSVGVGDLEAVKRSKTLVEEAFPFVPGTLRGKVLTVAGESVEMPAAFQQQLELQVREAGGRVLLTWSTPWPAVYGQRVELGWPGATSADQAALDLNGGVFATPPFEVDLRPVIRVDTTEVAAGDAVGSAEDAVLLSTLTPPEGAASVARFDLFAGEHAVFAVDFGRLAQQVVDRFALERGGAVDAAEEEGWALAQAGGLYLRRLAESLEHLSALRWRRLVGLGNVVLAVQRGAVSRAADGTPLTFAPAPPAVDLGSMILGLFPPDGVAPSAASAIGTLELLGSQASFLESRTLGDVLGGDHLSAVTFLTRAVREGQTLTRVDATNVDVALGAAELSGDAEASVRAGVERGLVAWISETQLPFDTWDTTGYVLEDPASGAAGFFVTYERLVQGLGATIVFHTPQDLDIVTAPTDVVATLESEGEIESWNLSYRAVEGDRVVALASGAGTFVNATLAPFDPTFLLNGLYEIALTARDPAGQSVTGKVTVTVEGNLKIGNFTLPLLDVEVPVAGIPIQVVRTYDSRDKRVGDFGVGWRLSLSDVQLQENGPPGLGWQGTVSPGPFPAYCILPTRPHIVTIVFPDGEVFRFQPRVSPECQPLVPQQVVDVDYAPLPGTRGQLEPLDLNTSGLLVVGSFPGAIELWDQFVVAVHDASTYRLTLEDGRVFVIEQRDGLQSITDLNGNVVSFSAAGIEHSSGLGISFERDALDRITAIVDPRGGRLTYEYDAAGDLVRFTDQEDLTTEYRYLADHFLDTIIDPDGTEIVAAEYDGDGRLIRNCDAGDNCSRLVHDLGSGTETFIDGAGRPMAFTYDNRGNVLTATDALGHTTRAEYSDIGTLTRLTDPLGNVTEYTYDGRGNLLSIVRPHAEGAPVEDFTTSHTYNSRGQMTSVTLPTGGQVLASYDSRGNLEAIRDENDNLILGFGYDASGNVISETGPFGTLSYSDLEPSGEPRRIVDESGGVTDVTYDAMGEVTGIENDRFTATFTYDAKGRSTRDDFGNGLVAERTYRNSDDWVELTGPTYGRVERKLTASSRLAGWEVDGIGAVDFAYDASGRPFRQTDPEGNALTYEYDAAGRLETVVSANTGETRFVRDAAGRVVEVVDALGHSASTTYGPDGQPASFTDPNGETWSFSYTPATTTITDPLGRTETLYFSPHGLHTATVHDDGSRSDAEYLLTSPLVDADEFPTSITDEGGHVRSYGYDAFGRLTSATNLGGAAFTYEYDDGNLTRVVGPSTAELLALAYDARDNLATLTFPDGGVEERAYDAANRLARITRPSDTVIDFTYDAGGRLSTRASAADPAATAFAWNANSQLESTTDGRGATAYQYDGLTHLERIDYPDGSSVQYTRDLLGQVTAVEVRSAPAAPVHRTEYTWDPAGNLVQVVDPLGGITALEYDSVNRLTRRTLPNGVVSEMTYNVRDQLTAIVHRAPDTTVLASQTWERSGVGEPGRIVRHDGSSVELDYDAALRLVEERHFDAASTLVETITYTYDADGNRLTLTDAAGSSTYTYAAGDRLVSVSGTAGDQTFTYDADGRVGSIDRDGETLTLGYDSADQLLSVTDTSGPVAAYTYDAAGRRVEADDVAGGRSFVVAPAMGGGLESTHLVTDGAGALVAGYVYAGELPLMRFGPDGPVYYLTDPLGSVISLADGAGSSVAAFTYDGFGRLREASGPAAPAPAGAGGDFRFHGGWLEEATGLYHFRARDYDPRIGRFLSRDTAEPNLFVPETLHPYGFANANPLVFRDPTGQFSIMSVNISMSIQGIIHSIKLAALNQIRRYLIDKIGEAVTDLLIEAMFKIMFASIGSVNPFSKGIEAWQAGMKFQEILTNAICDILGPAGSSIIWFDTPIDPDNGKPKQNGFQCGPGKKGVSADVGDKKPDFLLKQGPPINLNKKGFLIGDFKISIKTFYKAYINKGYNKRQWKAMYRHAQEYQFLPRAVLFIAFHKGKRYHWKELAQLAITQRVALIIFSFK